MSPCLRFVFVAVVVFISVTSNSSAARKKYTTYTSEYLLDWCGMAEMQVSGYGLIKLWNSLSVTSQRPNKNCTVSYDARGAAGYHEHHYGAKLSISVERIRRGCYTQTPSVLHIYDGKESGDEHRLRSVRFDREWSGETFYHSTSPYITFQYVTYESVVTYSCFPDITVRYTRFTDSDADGGCDDASYYTYECSNDRCIDDDLVCDGYNNCANDNDETGFKCTHMTLAGYPHTYHSTHNYILFSHTACTNGNIHFSVHKWERCD